MTGKIGYTPEARRHLRDLGDWIAEAATPEIATRFVGAITGHINGIPIFPFAGRSRDDIRRGVRITSFRKKTVVAYEVDESADNPVINILGVFHGGQDWETTLREQLASPDES